MRERETERRCISVSFERIAVYEVSRRSLRRPHVSTFLIFFFFFSFPESKFFSHMYLTLNFGQKIFSKKSVWLAQFCHFETWVWDELLTLSKNKKFSILRWVIQIEWAVSRLPVPSSQLLTTFWSVPPSKRPSTFIFAAKFLNILKGILFLY